MNFASKIGITAVFLVASFSVANSALASTTDGTVDSAYKYAWGENVGWLNFGTAEGNVHITDSALTGYIWGENIGWISLNCSNENSCFSVDYKVSNDGAGNLSGYAWSENTGWLNFSPTYGGVTINSSGEFSGYAWGENIGWVVFSCSTTNSCAMVEYGVRTDWRPQSARTTTSTPTPSGDVGSVSSPKIKPPTKKPKKLLMPGFLNPKPSEATLPGVPIEALVSKEAPLALQGKWQLLSREPIREFVLAPLPEAIRSLAQKFPMLEKTFAETGIAKITDVAKLNTVKLTLPGLTERIGLPTAKVEPGKFTLSQGVPIANLSPSIKQQLPTETVFARASGGSVDFNTALSVTEKGEPQQKISTISGKPLQLVVKPGQPAKNVKGYVVFKSKGSQPTSLELPFNSLFSSAIFADPVLAKTQEKPVRVEEKLVLLEFEYTDPDGDGIYTAEIQAPVIEGEYEIITVMDFEDPELGKKEIRLTTVIDPEGYLYEKNGDKETRIPGAIVSLFWLNPNTKQYEIWPAKEYQQENPQTTDVRGTYSFLVPGGYYYLKAEVPGYLGYDGKPFQVKEGSGIHLNIELKTKYWWLKIIDWKTILLGIIIILLLYNFYRDKIRERLMKPKNI